MLCHLWTTPWAEDTKEKDHKMEEIQTDRLFMKS